MSQRKKHLHLTITAAVSVFSSLPAGSAKANFYLCNKTKDDMSVASGFFDTSVNDWISRGWILLKAHSCFSSNYQDRRVENQSVFFFAQNHAHTWGGGNDSLAFCVSLTSAFAVQGIAKHCDAIGMVARHFYEDHLDADGDIHLNFIPDTASTTSASTPSVSTSDSPSRSFETQSKALKLITDTASSICSVIEHTGADNQSTTLSADVKNKVSDTAGQLANLGIHDASKYDEKSYRNVLQTDLLAAINKNSECKLEVFNVLQKKLLR